MFWRTLSMAILVAATGGCGNQADKSPVPAEIVYLNGHIYTVNGEQPWASAMAVHEGRFVFVGGDDEAKAYIGPATPTVDLDGLFVMPGIQDAHVHNQMVAEFSHNLSIDPDQPWAQIAKQIVDYAASHPDKAWILGGNLPWLTQTIGDNADAPARREVLDALVPDTPVALWDVGGHAMLANSRALELAGIEAETPDPTGGTIERDANGDATGVLRELATGLILENATAMSVDAYADGMKAGMAQLASLGITSINEVWTFPTTLNALKQLDDAGQLDMRVVVSIAHPVEFVTPDAQAQARDLINRHKEYRGQRLDPRYVKYVLDGSAGGQTLALIDPYVDSTFTGDMRNPEDVVKTEVARLHAEGIGAVLHAVGDRAIRVALDAVEGAIAQHGDNGVRHVIAHTVFVNPDDLARFNELGVIAEFSPYFWWPSDGQEILRDELGETRLGWGFPVKSILESGAHLAAGSDWPVVFDPNPFPAIEAMVTRQHPGGSPDSFGKEHAITLPQALEIFTMGSAYELYQEEDTGSIEVGKYADFVVLNQNLMEVDIFKVHKTEVLTTVLEGAVIYQRED